MRSAEPNTNDSVVRIGPTSKVNATRCIMSRRENLSLDGRRALKKLLSANRRLNTAYLLKESFGQLWDYLYGARRPCLL